MKRFDKLVITSFIGPYLLSFFVAEFVLVMQFLWKYIDEILGKGFGLFELLELIMYFMVTQIPMALPIAILISSVMVFGNLSERYELSSMKSAGVSLLRIMRPGIMIALGTAGLSLLASNYLKPQANFKFQKRFKTIQSQKPSLTIEEKIFNKDFKGFAIRVDEKSKDGEGIVGVSVYDHTRNDKSLLNFIKSDSGRMYNSEDGSFFIMELNNGIQYSESTRKKGKDKRKKYPFMRTEFETWKKSFDLGEFETNEDGIRINRNKEDMLNTLQLIDAIDSVDRFQDKVMIELFNPEKAKPKKSIKAKQSITKSPKTKNKSKAITRNKTKAETNNKFTKAIAQKGNSKFRYQPNKSKKRKIKKIDFERNPADSTLTTIAQLLNVKDSKRYLTKAIQSSGRLRDKLRSSTSQMGSSSNKRSRYILRLNQQYAFAMICIVFMFIGGPLGSIIRKGGYGYPLLIAILFYMVFIIMTIMGEKLVRSSTMNPIFAAWFSNILVIPVALSLTYMALKDMTLKSLSIKPSFLKKNLEG